MNLGLIDLLIRNIDKFVLKKKRWMRLRRQITEDMCSVITTYILCVSFFSPLLKVSYAIIPGPDDFNIHRKCEENPEMEIEC